WGSTSWEQGSARCSGCSRAAPTDPHTAKEPGFGSRPGGTLVGVAVNHARDRRTMSGRTHVLAARLVFPLILGGTIALALALLPSLGAPLTLSVATGVGLVAVMVAERVWPYRPV